MPTAGQVQRRIRQYRALTDEATCLRLAQALVHAKVEGPASLPAAGHARRRATARAGPAAEPDRHPGRPAGSRPTPPIATACAATKGTAAVHYFQGLRPLLGAAGAGRAALDDAQPPAAAGPLQRPVELRLRPVAHGRHAGGAGRRAWSRRWASSTRRAVRPIRWCWT